MPARPQPPTVVTVAVSALVACGGSDGSPLERDVERGLGAQLGVKVDKVTCSGGPPANACQAKIGDQWLPISVVPAQGGGLAWALTGMVVAVAPIERYLVAELAALGLAADVDCGTPVRAARLGERIACSLAEHGAAWITVSDELGSVDIEVALGGDAVRARSDDADVAGLDELSAALDLGAVSGEPPEQDPAADADAGAGP